MYVCNQAPLNWRSSSLASPLSVQLAGYFSKSVQLHREVLSSLRQVNMDFRVCEVSFEIWLWSRSCPLSMHEILLSSLPFFIYTLSVGTCYFFPSLISVLTYYYPPPPLVTFLYLNDIYSSTTTAYARNVSAVRQRTRRIGLFAFPLSRFMSHPFPSFVKHTHTYTHSLPFILYLHHLLVSSSPYLLLVASIALDRKRPRLACY